MEEKNNKKYSMFYAIFGIITLIVAIIGSTIAYFSVAVEGNNNKTVITGQTAQGILLKLEVEKVTTGATGNLIPLDTMEPWYLADKSQLQDALGNTTSCVDNAGSTVCQVYKVTISGEEFGNSTIRALGTLNLTSNASDMKWKVLTNATTDSTNTANGVGTASSINGSAGVALSNAKKSDTYYIAIWLEETNTDQSGTSNNETGKNYTGTVHFDAVDASGTVTNLTATFSNNGITESKGNAVEYISNLYLNNKSTIVENGPEGNRTEYQYAEIVSLMNDRLGGTTSNYDEGNIRYYGANPNNYIDIGDVYTEETTINNMEKNSFFIDLVKMMGTTITDEDTCKAYFDCDTNYANLGTMFEITFNNANECKTYLDYDVEDMCGTTTKQAGEPRLYRIIGLFKDVELKDGSKQDLIKVIREDAIGDFAWDLTSADESTATHDNNWHDATLMTILKNSYLTNSPNVTHYSLNPLTESFNTARADFTKTGLSPEANKIEEVVWNLGGYNTDETYPNVLYEAERGEAKCDTCTYNTTWTGKIALAYPSDQGYGADFRECSSMFNYYGSCNSVNWMSSLANGSIFEWLLTPRSDAPDFAWYVTAGGVYDNFNVDIGIGVRPVFYLNSELDIVSGEGTESSPYVLG